jgi:hypothetical protein
MTRIGFVGQFSAHDWVQKLINNSTIAQGHRYDISIAL